MKPSAARPAFVAALMLAAASPAAAQEATAKDLLYATVDRHPLALDLYLPREVAKPPLVIYIHGGGWRGGSRKKCLTSWLTEYGFAVASVSYRLTGKATFPAQLHDCKGAIRWLRAHADEYGYDASRIGVTGTSAGGHLALMSGVTGDDPALEGEVGGNSETSSRIQAVVDYYGPSDFLMRAKTQPLKTEPADSPVYLLLGGPASKLTDKARFASPAYHVSKDDSPLLILQGQKDTTVEPDQSERMAAAYREQNLSVQLELIPDAGHGSKRIFAKKYRDLVAGFLRLHLSPPSP